MSTQQPEALRLADELDGTVKTGYWEAAAELRRLHSVNADLLEALKLCEGNIKSLLASAHPKVYGEWLTFVSAAIAKATGQ
jgi:hypothetical protein